MGDSKLKYQRSIMVLGHEHSMAGKIKNAIKRYRSHKDSMRPVDLNEVVEKYAPGSVAYYEEYKINFHTEGSDYIVICDPAGYLRIQNLRTKCFVDYFTGKDVTKKEGLTEKEVLEKTHFRIKRREEMK